MRLLCFLFMFLFLNVSKAFHKGGKTLNDNGINKHLLNYLVRRMNGPIDGRIENGRRAQVDKHTDQSWLSILRQFHHDANERRQFAKKTLRNRRRYTDESCRESSTSKEMKIWNEQFNEDWNREKAKALAAKKRISPNAVLNMAAARPWSVPCGDPVQHDQPWGTCTLPFQCTDSLRIYRGDFQCGYTNFICCGALATHHDMYQGLDISFVDTGSSSTGEREKHEMRSTRIRYNKHRREKIRRWKKRRRSKQRLKRMIRRLSHEITKNLHRAFRNTSMDRKYKIKDLKKTIKKLKTKFRQERLKLKMKMHGDIAEADYDLKVRLTNVNNLNSQYLTNETFRTLMNKFNLTVKDVKALRTIPDELKPYLLSPTNNSVDEAVENSKSRKADARKFEELKEVNETEEYVIEETTPPVNLSRVSNDSSVEEYAYPELDENIYNKQGNLDEITPVANVYSMVSESVTSPIETRRFEKGIMGSQRKPLKKLNSERYIDQDIEIGKFYY